MFARVQGLFGYGNVHSNTAAANSAEKKQPPKTYSLRTVVAAAIAGIALGTIAERYQFKKYLAPIGLAISNGFRTVCSFASKNTGRICAAGVSAASAHPYIATAVGVATVGGVFFGIRHYRKNALRNNENSSAKPAQKEIKDIENEKGQEKAIEKDQQKNAEGSKEDETEARKAAKSVAEEALSKHMNKKSKAKAESKQVVAESEGEGESESEGLSSVKDKKAKFERLAKKEENKENKNAASPESKSTEETPHVEEEEEEGVEGEEEGAAEKTEEGSVSGLD